MGERSVATPPRAGWLAGRDLLAWGALLALIGIGLVLAWSLVPPPTRGASDPFAAAHGDQHRDQPTQRGAEQHESLQRQLTQQRLHVLEVDERHIAHRILGVGALATAPEIDADHPPVPRQARGNPFEVAGVPGKAGDADDWGAGWIARIIAIV